jgi:hypothetical protein
MVILGLVRLFSWAFQIPTLRGRPIVFPLGLAAEHNLGLNSFGRSHSLYFMLRGRTLRASASHLLKPPQIRLYSVSLLKSIEARSNTVDCIFPAVGSRLIGGNCLRPSPQRAGTPSLESADA